MKRNLLFITILAIFAAGCEKLPAELVKPLDGTAKAGEDGGTVKIEAVTIRTAGTGAYAKSLDLTLTERQVVALEVKTEPAGATEAVTFKCDDTMIARVSRKGVITARSAGKTDIHVLVGAVEMAVCHLTVEVAVVTVNDFALDCSKVEIDWGRDAHVFVNKVDPGSIAIGDTFFDFTTSDAAIFTVEPEFDGFGCVIHGIYPGEATLTVSVDGKSRTVPVTIRKKRIREQNWVMTTPEVGYKIEQKVYDETLRACRAWLFAGFPTFIYLVDDYGNRVKGEYGFEEYSGATMPYPNAVWMAMGEDGVAITPSADKLGRQSYDGISDKCLTFKSDLYVFERSEHAQEYARVACETYCLGFISFREGDNLDVLVNDSGSAYDGKPLTSALVSIHKGTSLNVCVADPGANSYRGFGAYVYESRAGGSYKWFDWSSQNGLVSIEDSYPGEDMSDGDVMTLHFDQAGSETIIVKDKFGHVRNYNITINI